jgi:NAD-specific glutamate dehydrogenase
MVRKYLNELRRIDLLIAQARRQRGDIDTSQLTDRQRDWFERWQQQLREYVSQFNEPDEYYAATLENDYRDRFPLREDVAIALFVEMPRILATDDDTKAAEKYTRYCHG